MKNQEKRGFTLIELMAVVLVVGILSAVTIPQLIEINRRGHLDEMTNLIARASAATRSIAMRSRRAAVLEIRGNQMWINTLQGSGCDSDIDRRCVQNMGSTKNDANTNILTVNSDVYGSSGITLCSIRFAGENENAGTCDVTSVSVDSAALAICYSGQGELYIRNSTEANAVCAATSAPAAATWIRGCSAWGNQPGNAAANNTAFSGAELRLNRFENGTGACAPGTPASATQLGVTREVQLPAGAHPFSRVAR